MSIRVKVLTAGVGVIVLAAVIVAVSISPTDEDLVEAIQGAHKPDREYSGLSMWYPLDGTLFPEEMAATHVEPLVPFFRCIIGCTHSPTRTERVLHPCTETIVGRVDLGIVLERIEELRKQRIVQPAA